MNAITKILGGAALVAGLAVGGNANASYISSFSTVTGGSTVVGGSVAAATAVNFGTTQLQGLTGSGAVYGTAFTTALTLSPGSIGVTAAGSGAATFVSPFTMDWTANGIAWAFTASTGTFTRNSAGGSNTISLYFAGTLTDTTNATYGAQTALFVDSFSQAGGGSIAESGSFATPIPEPVTMTLLASGLGALALVRRRSSSI
jgi:hypothetical protein